MTEGLTTRSAPPPAQEAAAGVDAAEWDRLREFEPRALFCWLATGDTEFGANVSPKELFCLPAPGRMLIAEIASARSLANLAHDPRVCVGLVDIFRRHGGYKLYGRARVIGRAAAEFTAIAAPLTALAGDTDLIRHVIAIDVARLVKIPAPAHLLRD